MVQSGFWLSFQNQQIKGTATAWVVRFNLVLRKHIQYIDQKTDSLFCWFIKKKKIQNVWNAVCQQVGIWTILIWTVKSSSSHAKLIGNSKSFFTHLCT